MVILTDWTNGHHVDLESEELEIVINDRNNEVHYEGGAGGDDDNQDGDRDQRLR